MLHSTLSCDACWFVMRLDGQCQCRGLFLNPARHRRTMTLVCTMHNATMLPLLAESSFMMAKRYPMKAGANSCFCWACESFLAVMS